MARTRNSRKWMAKSGINFSFAVWLFRSFAQCDPVSPDMVSICTQSMTSLTLSILPLKSCYAHNFVCISFNYPLTIKETNMPAPQLVELNLRSTNEFIPSEHFAMRGSYSSLASSLILLNRKWVMMLGKRAFTMSQKSPSETSTSRQDWGKCLGSIFTGYFWGPALRGLIVSHLAAVACFSG